MEVKNILYFHQYFSTGSGATGTRSYEFAKKLIEDGHNVTMVCCSTQLSQISQKKNHGSVKKRIYNVEGIRVIEFALNYSNRDSIFIRSIKFLSFAIRSTRLVFTEKYDLLFATSTPLTVALPGIIAKLVLRKKFIFEVRDLWPELPKAMGVIKNPIILKALDILETTAYGCADHVIALSPGIKEGVLQKNKNVKISMIPNGSDLNLFYPIKNESIKINGINSDDFVAIFTGAHGMANGLDAILDVAKILMDKGEGKIKFLFIGDGKEKPALIMKSNELNLTNCIFLDPIAKNQLNLYLGRASVGLMVLKNIPAFYYGTSPNKFFDYISAGLPVINNYPGWLCDMLKKFKAGQIVAPDNAQAFADKLIYLKENPEILISNGQNARKMAEDLFDRKALAKSFSDLLLNYL